MSGLRFAQSAFDSLRRELLEDLGVEACAVGFAARGGAQGTWVVREIGPAPSAAYERRDQTSAVLRPQFLVEVANRARRERSNVILLHTHPFELGIPSFSKIDDAGEIEIAKYLRQRAPGEHLSVVLGRHGIRARRLGPGAEVPAWSVGERLLRLTESPARVGDLERYDRQVRAFGQVGQRTIGSLRFGIVGAGGTGSLTIQQLAHLGARDFTLVDPDKVDHTNLNRLVGAGPSDVGKAKVEVAKRLVEFIQPDALVDPIQGDVTDDAVAQKLVDLDFIFLCTDSHASRAVVGQLAYQYLVPVIDMGVSITAKAGEVSHVTGRVQLLAPGQPCLACLNVLDPAQVRRELMTHEQRQADPYFDGAHVPHPSVISLNGTAASLAVTMFLGVATDAPLEARFLRYDGVKGVVRLNSGACVEGCVVCSPRGALARGSAWPLPTRLVAATEGAEG